MITFVLLPVRFTTPVYIPRLFTFTFEFLFTIPLPVVLRTPHTTFPFPTRFYITVVPVTLFRSLLRFGDFVYWCSHVVAYTHLFATALVFRLRITALVVEGSTCYVSAYTLPHTFRTFPTTFTTAFTFYHRWIFVHRCYYSSSHTFVRLDVGPTFTLIYYTCWSYLICSFTRYRVYMDSLRSTRVYAYVVLNSLLRFVV